MYRFASNLALLKRRADDGNHDTIKVRSSRHEPNLYRDDIGSGRTKARAEGLTPSCSTRQDRLHADVSMVQVGEEFGQLAVVMEQVARSSGEDGRHDSQSYQNGGTLIIMGMGSSIAGLMLAIYMPMFEMAGNVK